MTEPTYKQHKILESVNESMRGLYRNKSDEDMDELYELSRGGYLDSLVVMGGPYEWRFVLTEKAQKYLTTTP